MAEELAQIVPLAYAIEKPLRLQRLRRMLLLTALAFGLVDLAMGGVQLVRFSSADFAYGGGLALCIELLTGDPFMAMWLSHTVLAFLGGIALVGGAAACLLGWRQRLPLIIGICAVVAANILSSAISIYRSMQPRLLPTHSGPWLLIVSAYILETLALGAVALWLFWPRRHGIWETVDRR